MAAPWLKGHIEETGRRTTRMAANGLASARGAAHVLLRRLAVVRGRGRHPGCQAALAFTAGPAGATVIAGHFGLAAGIKARERAVPLWALMLASQWLDVVFVPLFLAKVERIETIGGGSAAGYGNGIIHADYTHSLVGALVLALVFAAPAAWRWGRRAAT